MSREGDLRGLQSSSAICGVSRGPLTGREVGPLARAIVWGVRGEAGPLARAIVWGVRGEAGPLARASMGGPVVGGVRGEVGPLARAFMGGPIVGEVRGEEFTKSRGRLAMESTRTTPNVEKVGEPRGSAVVCVCVCACMCVCVEIDT